MSALFDAAFEVERTLDFVDSIRAARVALQLPDELLKYAPQLVQRLQQRDVERSAAPEPSPSMEPAASSPAPRARRHFAILGDSTYAPCCVDEVAAAHLPSDCVIHYGHACLSAPSAVPVLFVFGRAAADVDGVSKALVAAVERAKEGGDEEKVLLLWEPCYAHAIPSILKRAEALCRTSAEGDGGVEADGDVDAPWKEDASGAVRFISPFPGRLIVPFFYPSSRPAARPSAAARCSCSCSSKSSSCACKVAGTASASATAAPGCDGSAGAGKGSSCSCDYEPAAAGPLVGDMDSVGSEGIRASPVAAEADLDLSNCCGLYYPTSVLPARSGVAALRVLHLSSSSPLPASALDASTAATAGLKKQGRARAIMLQFATAQEITFLNPSPASPSLSSSAAQSTISSRALSLAVRRQINAAYLHCETVKNAGVIGVVAGTLGIEGKQHIVSLLRRACEAAGKHCYLFLIGKLTQTKLGNFPEVDCFVLVACPESSLLSSDDVKSHAKPVVTPQEAFIGLKMAYEDKRREKVRDETGDYGEEDEGIKSESAQDSPLEWKGYCELDFSRLIKAARGLSMLSEEQERSLHNLSDVSTSPAKGDFNTEGLGLHDDDDAGGGSPEDGAGAPSGSSAITTAASGSSSALSSGAAAQLNVVAGARLMQNKRTWRGLAYEYEGNDKALAGDLDAGADAKHGASADGAGSGAPNDSLALISRASAAGALTVSSNGVPFDLRIREGLSGIASRYDKEAPPAVNKGRI